MDRNPTDSVYGCCAIVTLVKCGCRRALCFDVTLVISAIVIKLAASVLIPPSAMRVHSWCFFSQRASQLFCIVVTFPSNVMVYYSIIWDTGFVARPDT